jgi:hypothetical protein
MKYVAIFSFLFAALYQQAFSQDTIPENSPQAASRSFFHQRNFGKYFISDIYAPVNSIQVGSGLNLREYNISTSRNALYVPYNETTLGVEIPIYQSARTSRKGKDSRFAVSIPISANIWFDFFEKVTAPILNTDYRFGVVELNYLKQIDKWHIKNFAIKLVPLFHESTHLGDELTLFRLTDSLPIIRVNVSYELADLALTVNDPDGSIENNHSFKVGARSLLNPSKGWYSIRSVEGDTTKVVPSTKWFETYFQYQHQRSKGFLASKNAVSVFSLEVRDRVRFGYPSYLTKDDSNIWIGSGELEEKRLSFNGYLGWKFTSDVQKHPKLGAYLRWYTGINPHGQFRNVPFYDFVGFAIVYQN